MDHRRSKSLIYFDSAYIVKCSLHETGSKEVRGLAEAGEAVASCELARGRIFRGRTPTSFSANRGRLAHPLRAAAPTFGLKAIDVILH